MLPLPSACRASFAALLLIASHSAQAQTLRASSGQNVSSLFSSAANHYFDGLTVDAAANVFYLDEDSDLQDADGNQFTRLLKRGSDGVVHELFSFGDHGTRVVFGSFVRLFGQEIYWGESTFNTLWHGTLASGGDSLTSVSQLGTFRGAFDLVIASATTAYLSADPSGQPENHIYQLTLDQGTVTPTSNSVSKVFLSGDYSGPVALDASGRLIYGKAGAEQSGGGLYRYDAAELAQQGELTTDSQHQVHANDLNYGLAFNGDRTILFQDTFSELRQFRYDDGSFQERLLATTSDTLGPLAAAGDTAYTVVTSYSTGRSSVFAVTPEPSAGLLFLLAAAGWAGRRRTARRL